MGKLHNQKVKAKGKNKDKGGAAMGRALQKDLRRKEFKSTTSRHTVDLNDGQDYGTVHKSITECPDAQDFLLRAQAAGKSFAAEKSNVKFIQKRGRDGILTSDERERFHQVKTENKNSLRIPRRPQWDKSMSKTDLDLSENLAFETWRKMLCLLGSVEGIKLTPYERNIEFWRQLWRTVERSDVVVQIVDARDPLMFYCEDLQNYVKEVGFTKMSMLLVNKADFLTEKQRLSWIEYFSSIQVDVIFYSAAEQSVVEKEDVNDISTNINELHLDNSDFEQNSDAEEFTHSNEISDEKDPSKKIEEDSPVSDSPTEPFDVTKYVNSPKLLSKDELAELFENVHTGPKSNEKHVTVGLVGYPNVGKSSTINSLLQSKKVSVSATPGKTKHFQTLYLTPKLVLCDCPGLVFPGFVSTKAEMYLSGILSVDEMTNYEPPINQLLDIVPRGILESTYGIELPVPGVLEDPNRPPTAEDFLSAYGHCRGFMSHKGMVDKPRTARVVLKDFVKGHIVYCRAPPGLNQNEYHKVKAVKERKLNQKPKSLKKEPKEQELLFKETQKEKVPNAHTFDASHVNAVDMGRNVIVLDDGSVIKPWRVQPKKRRQKLRVKFAHLDH